MFGSATVLGGDVPVEMTAPASRLLGGLIACLGAAAVWFALSLCLGGSAAQAAERPAGLLDDLGEVVDSATSAAAGAVDGVVAPVVDEVVAPVLAAVGGGAAAAMPPALEAVSAVPVAGPVAAEVVGGTGAVAADAVDAADRLLTGAPVTGIADPVLDGLRTLPVLGGVVGELDPVLGAGLSGVDSIVGSLGSAAIPVLEPVVSIVPGGSEGPSGPGQPGSPGGPATPATPAWGADRAIAHPHDPSASTAARAGARAEGRDLLAAGSAATSGPPGVVDPAAGSPPGSTPHPGAPPGTASVPAPSSSASGGGTGVPLALASETTATAADAATREAGAGDDRLPASPVFDTDASPD